MQYVKVILKPHMICIGYDTRGLSYTLSNNTFTFVILRSLGQFGIMIK